MDRVGIFYIVLICYMTNFTNTGRCGGSGDGKISDELPLHELRMTTEMFNYTLYWDAPPSGENLCYTVIFQYDVKYSYIANNPDELLHCSNITERRCNIASEWLNHGDTENDIAVYYRVEGKQLGSNKILYRTREIWFHPHVNVSLVPPEFDLKVIRSPDNSHVDLFVIPVDQKHWKDGKSIKNHVKELRYQIQYWTRNDTDKRLFTKELNQEIYKKLPRGPTYYVRLRLYAKFSEGDIMSPWTETKSIETTQTEPNGTETATENDTTNSPLAKATSQQPYTIIIATSCGIVVIIILILLGCCGRKIRKICKSIHGKGPLPDTLVTIFRDNDGQTQNHSDCVYNYITEEYVDLLPPSEPFPCVPNYSELQVPTQRQYTLSGTSSCGLSTELTTDEYLRLPPVFDDEPLPNETTKFNMTYGIGYVYDPDIDYCLDTTQTQCEFTCDSATLRRPILASFLSNTESMLSPNDAISRRHFTMSLSSYGSEMGPIFDIQRSNDAFARSNFYLAQITDSQIVNTSGDIMNVAYSSDPVTKMPDVLITEYENTPVGLAQFQKDHHAA